MKTGRVPKTNKLKENELESKRRKNGNQNL
jgi:hypothetical protein